MSKHTRTFRSKKLHPEHVKLLNEAIRRNAKGGDHNLHISYTKADGSKSDRKVKPLAVKGTSLFVAHCHKRNAIRSFKVERINMIKQAFWDGFEKAAVGSGLFESIKDIPHRIKKEGLRVAAEDVYKEALPHMRRAQAHLKNNPKKYIAGALLTGAGVGYHARSKSKEDYAEKKTAEDKEPSWWQKQKGAYRIMRRGDSGVGRFLAHPDLVKSRFKEGGKDALKGLAVGGLGGAGIGTLLEGKKGLLIGAGLGGLLGVDVGLTTGAHRADKKYMKAHGVDLDWLGRHKFSPEAKSKYIDAYEKKAASDKDFILSHVEAYNKDPHAPWGKAKHVIKDGQHMMQISRGKGENAYFKHNGSGMLTMVLT